MAQENLHIGIDVGSTTVKLAILDEQRNVHYAVYRRHHADVRATIVEVLSEAAVEFGDLPMTIAITGSGGLLLAQWLGLSFIQEVIASKTAVECFIPKTDVAIELGGEDAKIIYFDNGIEQRMNGTCAGGTGAFIDQMAALLNTDAGGLNELAKSHTTIYPIASRCGVFAKTDVQPLLNEGAKKEDIAASIFQSVVTQTISGLACGRPIRGHVAFLGGPLQYLPELRKRFYETLDLDDDHIIVPDDAHLFVAKGCALAGIKAEDAHVELLNDVLERLRNLGDVQGSEVVRLPPLFKDEADYAEFKARHDKERVERADLATYEGTAFLGIDAGSTTFKAALIDDQARILWSHYVSNKGDVLGCAKTALAKLYSELPVDEAGNPKVKIAHSTVTGYGEGLLLEALRVDSGEIETVAHLRGAQEMLPGVEFILDIGGQDMKCLRVKDGVIDSIMLNEACSSGCGSFIESFASGLNLEVSEFAKTANKAENPVDLGSRCTVFMNSRVKQAQKEGATVGDIAAGLAISVIKNALFKVIKIRDPHDVGEKVIVQGGTFLNDSVLRAFEQLSEVNAVRPDIAGNMGAYGAALLARDRAKNGAATTLLSAQALEDLHPTHRTLRCKQCSNACLLTVNDFGKDPVTGKHRRFITGNRCEKGAGTHDEAKAVPNLYDFKSKLLFDRPSLPPETAPRGTVGIPRALSMYENYPFWHAFFTKLGYSVIVSDASTKKTYEAGIESMPSESVCYPAKLSHGHVMNLLEKEPDFIWFPCSRFERMEDSTAGNHYHCPIVSSYAESLRLNIDELLESKTKFVNPWLPYDQKEHLKKRLFVEMTQRYAAEVCSKGTAPTQREVDAAVEIAWEEDENFKRTMRAKGEETLEWMEENGVHGIVLAGRPYHNDPEINHAIPELLTSFGLAVLTEDSVAHLGTLERPIRVVDQWMYHTRLYAAAKVATQRDDLDLIQLNSFGCGLDALTTDQVQEILEASGKVYTVLKIDEVSNLGAARIRVRSLLAALMDKQEEKADAEREAALAAGEACPAVDAAKAIVEDARARVEAASKAHEAEGKTHEVAEQVEIETADVPQVEGGSWQHTDAGWVLVGNEPKPAHTPEPATPVEIAAAAAGEVAEEVAEAASHAVEEVAEAAGHAVEEAKGLRARAAQKVIDTVEELAAEIPRGPRSFVDKASAEVAKRFKTRNGASTEFYRAQYTQQMKDERWTILCPQMAPIHFDLLIDIFDRFGYNIELLPSVDTGAVDAGLKYVNNDICYPSILVTGQIMEAVMSGRYDTDKLAVIITQTGGGCRATNYIALIRKALKEAGLEHVPVISLSFKDLDENNPGFNMTPAMLFQAIYALVYGDLLMQCLYRCRPYEVEEGSVTRLFDQWMDTCKRQLARGVHFNEYKKTCHAIVRDFDAIPLQGEGTKPRVGVVGEILVKFHPTANNQVVDVIEREGCEAVVPGLIEFFTFSIVNAELQRDEMGKPLKSALGSMVGLKALTRMRKPATDALKASKRFEAPADIYELATYTEGILSHCNSMGEGWLLTAEMIELIKTGAPNIVCAQPFACLPNHVVGKSVIKELRRRYPTSNIVAVDYDPGASEVNQLNRIKLMISVAKANLAEGRV